MTCRCCEDQRQAAARWATRRLRSQPASSNARCPTLGSEGRSPPLAPADQATRPSTAVSERITSSKENRQLRPLRSSVTWGKRRSAQRFLVVHGKDGVAGSIPAGGSTPRLTSANAGEPTSGALAAGRICLGMEFERSARCRSANSPAEQQLWSWSMRYDSIVDGRIAVTGHITLILRPMSVVAALAAAEGSCRPGRTSGGCHRGQLDQGGDGRRLFASWTSP